ncbi:MAG: hypothetical protein Q8K72_02775, partial [Acidimicrobiales bacterium]|nr:hypothetical protein [Acidimicrobiales bacterium]
PAATSTPDASAGVQVAIAQATAPQDWLYLSDDEVAAAIGTATTPEAQDRLTNGAVSELHAARDALAGAPGAVWWLVRPLAWRATPIVGDSMSVSVWTVSILAARDLASPQTTFRTTTIDLTRAQGRWLVADLTSNVGPTPDLGPGALPDDSRTFDRALDGYTRIGDAG